MTKIFFGCIVFAGILSASANSHYIVNNNLIHLSGNLLTQVPSFSGTGNYNFNTNSGGLSGRGYYKKGRSAFKDKRFADAKNYYLQATEEGGLSKSDFNTIIQDMLSIGDFEAAAEFSKTFVAEFPNELKAYQLQATCTKLYDKDTTGKAVEPINAYNAQLRKQKSFSKDDRKTMFDNYNYLFNYYTNKAKDYDKATVISNKMSALYPNTADEKEAAILKKLVVNPSVVTKTVPVKSTVKTVTTPTVPSKTNTLVAKVETPTVTVPVVSNPLNNYSGITPESLLKTGDDAFVAGKYDLAAQNWQAADRLGNKVAGKNLGILYEKGLGVTQDYKKAAEYYQIAAIKGVPEAGKLMGNLFENGLGVNKDTTKAIEWYNKAIELGDTTAKANVNLLQAALKPKVVAPVVRVNTNPNTVVYTNTVLAAGSNNADALYNKGFDAYKLKNYASARELWEKAAATTKPSSAKYKAMNVLGQLYQNGEGVEKSYDKALEWYIAATADGTAMGSADAAKSVGTLYENGWGVEENFTEALKWYKKAQKMGNKYSVPDIKRMEDKIKKFY